MRLNFNSQKRVHAGFFLAVENKLDRPTLDMCPHGPPKCFNTKLGTESQTPIFDIIDKAVTFYGLWSDDSFKQGLSEIQSALMFTNHGQSENVFLKGAVRDFFELMCTKLGVRVLSRAKSAASKLCNLQASVFSNGY